MTPLGVFSASSGFFQANPKTSGNNPLSAIIEIEHNQRLALEEEVKNSLVFVEQTLKSYKFEGTVEHQDAIFVEKFFSCFLKPTVITMREVHFKNVKKKPCGRGKIDIVMGTLGNGNKPHVQVKESDKSITNVFVTSVQEAKKIFFRKANMTKLKAFQLTISELGKAASENVHCVIADVSPMKKGLTGVIK